MSEKNVILHVWLLFRAALRAGLFPSSLAALYEVTAPLFFAGLRPNISLPLILGSG